ncbi:ATP-binding protein [Roseimarinus sediminis]|uniref:ATP-binding protein n=1 Tax=Roseimarinus sediminis TaxID=1610899 RepID=UPI003D1B4356
MHKKEGYKISDKKFLLLIFAGFFLLMLSAVKLHANRQETDHVIKVGVYNNHPKLFINNKGKPDGFFIDIIKAIAKESMLQIEYVPGEWSQLYEMLLKGEIDMLPDVAYSPERDSLFTFCQLPVINSWLEVFTPPKKTIHSMQELNGLHIGVLKGSIQEELLNNQLAAQFNLQYQLHTFSDYKSNVEALEREFIDVMIADRFFYFSDLFGIDLHPSGIVLRPTELFFVFSKESDKQLTVLFDTQLANLKNNPGSAYYRSLSKWLDRHYPFILPLYIRIIILGITVVLLVVLIFMLLLKQQVKKQTRDLSQRNEELEKAKERAEQSDQLKTVFLQNMSHEIRTPMNGIIGFLELLEEPDLEVEQKKAYIKIMNKSGQRLLNTINNIIEISQIESKQVNLNLSPVNVKEVIEFQFSFFQQLATEKGLGFSISTQTQNDEAIIVTDEHLLSSMLTNLISNAIKYTVKGEIKFGNYIDNNSLVFFVSDTGIGIPEDRMEAIYDSFVQADLNITRSHEGSGLGLSIVKAYAGLLNGRLWLESEQKVGSTFYFALPIKPQEKR